MTKLPLPPPVITRTELIEYELTHDHAGNGLAMVEDIDSDWCRVVRMGVNHAGQIPDAFLAWKKKLKVHMMSPKVGDPPEPVLLTSPRVGRDEFLKKLSELREGFKNGLLRTRDTHIIKASPPKSK